MSFFLLLYFCTMLFYVILCSTMIYYDVLWSIMIYYDVILYCTILYYTVLYCTILYYVVLCYIMIYYDLLWCIMIYYDVLLYCTMDVLNVLQSDCSGVYISNGLIISCTNHPNWTARAHWRQFRQVEVNVFKLILKVLFLIFQTNLLLTAIWRERRLFKETYVL